MMAAAPQMIYFDESGFTGNDLLGDSQPAFVYTGVAIDPADAASILGSVTSRFRLNGGELKGKNLLGHPRGREAVSWILDRCEGKVCMAVANKRFALAGKFFEYTFEPVLAPNNALFYGVGFHQFIANFLYIALEAKHDRVAAMLGGFQDLMRTKDLTLLQRVLAQLGPAVSYSDPIDQILTFVLCHKEAVEAEIRSLSIEDGVGKWVLELTTTSLFWILSYWSEYFESMRVCCDRSKPLDSDRSVFDAMVGREDKIYVKWGTQPDRPLTYNLSEPIALRDSSEPGIQLADVMAGAVAYALRNPQDEISKEWLGMVEGMLKGPAVLPNHEAIDLHRRNPVINSLILCELVERTMKGESLLEGMEDYILGALQFYDASPPDLDQ